MKKRFFYLHQNKCNVHNPLDSLKERKSHSHFGASDTESVTHIIPEEMFNFILAQITYL